MPLLFFILDLILCVLETLRGLSTKLLLDIRDSHCGDTLLTVLTDLIPAYIKDLQLLILLERLSDPQPA